MTQSRYESKEMKKRRIEVKIKLLRYFDPQMDGSSQVGGASNVGTA